MVVTQSHVTKVRLQFSKNGFQRICSRLSFCSRQFLCVQLLVLFSRMNVYHHHNLLHQIQEMEFIDSPEFESGVTGDEKYQVSMT